MQKLNHDMNKREDTILKDTNSHCNNKEENNETLEEREEK